MEDKKHPLKTFLENTSTLLVMAVIKAKKGNAKLEFHNICYPTLEDSYHITIIVERIKKKDILPLKRKLKKIYDSKGKNRAEF